MILAIIQARLNSNRLPKKIFKKIVGRPLIWHIVDRLKFSKKIDTILIATTNNKKDNILCKWAKSNGIDIFRGSEENVVGRFYDAAIFKKLDDEDIIIRITSDDPFKDPEIIDKMISIMEEKKLDFIYNNKPPSFPEGLDIEIFKFSLLKNSIANINEIFDQEHVTQYFYRMDNIKKENFKNDKDISHLRWTLDTKEDLVLTRKIYKLLYKEGHIFLMNDILKILDTHKNLNNINKNVKRSFMYEKNK